jgi:hypothetical protein
MNTHVTAPTQFVEANGIRFAYRRFRRESREPLLFLQHFRGGMNHRDPAITDGFAMDRPVIHRGSACRASPVLSISTSPRSQTGQTTSLSPRNRLARHPAAGGAMQ